MWTKIKKIIPQKAKRFGLENNLEILNLKRDWDKMVGEALGNNFKKRSETINFKDHVLYVRCQNSTWAGEFQIKKEKLMDTLKKNKLNIKQIRFIF